MRYKGQSLFILKLDFLAFFSIVHRVLSIVVIFLLLWYFNLCVMYNVFIKIDYLYIEFVLFLSYFIIIFHICYTRTKIILILDKILNFVSNNIINISKSYYMLSLFIIVVTVLVYLSQIHVGICFVKIKEYLTLIQVFTLFSITKTGLSVYMYKILYFFFFMCLMFFKYKMTKKKVFNYFLFKIQYLIIWWYSCVFIDKVLFLKYSEIWHFKNFYFRYELDKKKKKIYLIPTIFSKWFQFSFNHAVEHNFNDPLYIVVLDSYIYLISTIIKYYSLFIYRQINR